MELTPFQQWKRTQRAARRRRLIAFEGCTTTQRLAAFEKSDRELRERVQKLVDAKVAPLIFGDYVNLA